MKTDEYTLLPVADDNAVRSLLQFGVEQYKEQIANVENANRVLIADYETNVEVLSILRHEKSQLEATLSVIR